MAGSSSPRFPTPLSQPIRSEVLEWRFPRPYSHFVLIGKSRAAWSTSFIVPQLNLLLDAGVIINDYRPKHVFLTHGHSDHTLLSPAFVKREDPPDIYCPAEIQELFETYVLAHSFLNLGVRDSYNVKGHKINANANGNEKGDDPKNQCLLPTHYTHGLESGCSFLLPRMKGIGVTTFKCDHTVPCLGYTFSKVSDRLQPRYYGLPGSELKTLRESGIKITEKHSEPIFAFLGDTTAFTLSGGEGNIWLEKKISVVITECSFLYPEHKEQANKTKHTIWSDLEPVVRKYPNTIFVLIHFSLRYKKTDIRSFFRSMADCPTNIVVWLDGED